MGSQMNKHDIGSGYEELAAAYLMEQGYAVIGRNFSCRSGEIDIIARDGEYLVFVEVKYRRDKRAGDPAEAVDYRKQQHIRRAAEYYLYRNRVSESMPCRFDVVSILGDEITLIRDAF